MGSKHKRIAIEITSNTMRREDEKKKFVLYRDVLRVPEYFQFDPTEDYLKPPMRRLSPAGRRLRADHAGRRPAPQRRAWPAPGARRHGTPVVRPGDRATPLTPRELAAQAEQQAAQAQRRAEAAEAEIDRLNRELDELRRRPSPAGE